MKLGKTLGMSDTTMDRIAEEDLRFKFYVIKDSTNAFRDCQDEQSYSL